MRDELLIYTVYERLPVYIVRRHLIEAGDVILDDRFEMISSSLDELRNVLSLSLGLTPMCRSEEDAPDIVETWI